MILPDVNVLIYAFRSDAPGHQRHKAWLEAILNGDAAYGMSPQVLSSVIRITTHPRIFTRPSRMEEVAAYCGLLLEQPHCQTILPGDRHWRIFLHLCRQAKAIGNLAQDAWLAALAIESGCEWITTDRDYARFPGLNWRTPF